MAKIPTPAAPALSLADEARAVLHNRFGTPMNRKMTRLLFAQILGAPDDSYPMTDAGDPEFDRFWSHFQVSDYCGHVAWWDRESLFRVLPILKPVSMFVAIESMVRHAERLTGAPALNAWVILAELLPVVDELGVDQQALIPRHREYRVAQLAAAINAGYAATIMNRDDDPDLAQMMVSQMLSA